MSNIEDPPQEDFDHSEISEGLDNLQEVVQESIDSENDNGQNKFQAAAQEFIDTENDHTRNRFQAVAQQSTDAENDADWEEYSESGESQNDDMEVSETADANIEPPAVAVEPAPEENCEVQRFSEANAPDVEKYGNVLPGGDAAGAITSVDDRSNVLDGPVSDAITNETTLEDGCNVLDVSVSETLPNVTTQADGSNVQDGSVSETIPNVTTQAEDDECQQNMSESDVTLGDESVGTGKSDQADADVEGDSLNSLQQTSDIQLEASTEPSPVVERVQQLKKELDADGGVFEEDDTKFRTPTIEDQNPLDFVTVNFYQLKCKFCNASFDRRKTWKKHIANEHGIQPYCCQLCGEGFDHKSDLKDHVRTHANETSTHKSRAKTVDSTTAGESSDSTASQAKIQQPRVQLGMSAEIQQRMAKAVAGESVQVPPDTHKLALTKSLKLLKVPRLRVTPDPITTKTTHVASSKPVPNKRKRGRPRRVTNTNTVKATPNKRKRSQPQKIKKGPIKPLKIVLPGANRKARIKEEVIILEEREVKPKPKVDIVKGPYTLRGQVTELDYKEQLQYKAEFPEADPDPEFSEPDPEFPDPDSEYPDPDPEESVDLKPFTCKFCDMGFKNKAKKLRHEKSHKSQKEFTCTTCSIRCTSYKTLKKHEDNHYPDEMKCHFCNEVYKIKKDLWSHEESHGKICTCRWCSATFPQRSELETHERMHFIAKGKEAQEKSVECAFCKKVCKSRKSWKSHLVSHSNIRSFECGICHKKYKQRGSFNLHMQRHNNTFYKFTCQFCGKKYGQKALLVIHERTHTNERPFQCGHCEKAFPSKNQLDHHMERVRGVRHMCSFCGKQLNSRSSLEIHERKHTGERPIKCEYCPMDFVEPSAYKYHLRVIHTGERFECKFCGKKCKAKGVLTAHMRVHTGERPFKCKYCEKDFRSGNVLRTHMQGIHLGVKVKCEICDRAFAQTSALNTHKKLVHQGLKWKDIQIQRKINREEREKRDRDLITNASVKPKVKDDEMGYEVDNAHVVPILSAIERSMMVPGMPVPALVENEIITEESSRSEVDTNVMDSSERSSADRVIGSTMRVDERVAETARQHTERVMMEAERQMMEARAIPDRNQMSARSATERNLMEASARSAAERNMMEATARSFAERNMMEASARSMDRGMMDSSMRSSLNQRMIDPAERSISERSMMETSARSIAEINMMEASARSVLERGMMSASTARHIENERNMMEAAARSAIDRRMMPGAARHMEEHERNMMAPSARPIGDPDKQAPVDVIFQPAISGAAMYHVL